MNQFPFKYNEVLVNNIKDIIGDLKQFAGASQRHKSLYIKNSVRYLYSDPILFGIIKKLEDLFQKNLSEVEKIKEEFNNIINQKSLLGHMMNDTQKVTQQFNLKQNKFNFPKDVIKYINASNGWDKIDRNSLLNQISDQGNPSDVLKYKEVINKELGMCYIQKIIEEEREIIEKYQELYRDGYFGTNNPGLGTFIKIFYHYSDPVKSAQLKDYEIPSEDEIPLLIWGLRRIIQILQQRNNLEYWINRYSQRAGSFNRTFVYHLKHNLDPNENVINELFVTQDLLLYLFDQGVPFSNNENKQRLWPDITLTYSEIEIKYIKPDDKISGIKRKIRKAHTEIEGHKRSHQVYFGFIVIFNHSLEYNLEISEQFKTNVKIIDLYLGETGLKLSEDERKIITIDEYLK